MFQRGGHGHQEKEPGGSRSSSEAGWTVVPSGRDPTAEIPRPPLSLSGFGTHPLLRPIMAAQLEPRLARSCDHCKAKKIRCLRPLDSVTCTPCLNRNIECHYSLTRRRLKPKEARASPSLRTTHKLSQVTGH
ncbi:hypothetical protein BO94DRAFT_148990 [Aspergillus sclerotioniger CBS 115572]|uniref:Zn(2)-C6 fungal-type domain-containing protein n=1 Tax=Aspergillus sclerotioniger CBS 115572 TaxID=1450535 RepID=A0A317W5Z6_9EURO|nr:hypothetical protein BO94DRAFT_148990 [Aspergillus sclerotioniger CBS 115572]PWY80732.1 hypothetical protein BO94DRAFT_148990 [Aspergillus sclerotioniger CBS 115572]